MKLFRIFGYYNQQYVTKVYADNADEAFDIAEKQETHKWAPVDTVTNIFPHEVYLEDDFYDPKSAAREYYRTKDQIDISSNQEIVS